MTAPDIEALVMESVTERTREYILMCIRRQSDVQTKSVFETYEPPRTVTALQAYRQIEAMT